MKKLTKIILIALPVAALLLLYLFSLPRELFKAPLSAVLESSDGRLLGARIAADGQWRFPPIDEVPDKYAAAVITYEDKRFRWHPGVDPLAIARAARLNLKSGEVRSGGSTITMQTIRLSRGNPDRTVGEKIIEMILATRLELRCSKNRILAMYASNAPFGGNVVGLPAASWRYFGRSCDELSWAESATLAVLPNSPALIHPGKGRDKLLEKRNFLLDKLMEAGIIDSTECELAKDEPLPEKPYPLPETAYHYLETLRKSGGDRMYSSHIDYTLQTRAEAVVSRYAEAYSANDVFNMAAIILDVESGEPLVYIGNAGHGSKANGDDVDVAQARRSSGSTLKPLLYGAMLDEGQILPDMLIPDIPFHYKDFSPSNYNHTFDGAVTARSVIQRSLNVPSVRMLHEYGIEKFLELLKKSGITTADRGADTYGLSLILGGAEIKLTELARCYRNMSAYLTGVIKEGCPLSKGAVWCTFDALTGVARPEEEGDWRSFSSSRQVAWKTGTSYGNRDAWSIGVTPEYVIAVWVGNCDGTGRPLLTGVGYAAPVMFDLFGLLPMTSWFSEPSDSLREVETCRLSGRPVSEACIADGTVTVLAPKAPQLPDRCSNHRIIHLSEDGQYRVDSSCYDVTKMQSVSWFVLPPAQEWYYMRTHTDYRQMPPLHPKFKGEQGASLLEIIYPQEGMTIATPTALDSKSRGAVFSAAHADPDAVLFWHIDGTFIGETSHGEHKVKVVPESGVHTLTVVDANGNSASVRFTSKE